MRLEGFRQVHDREVYADFWMVELDSLYGFVNWLCRFVLLTGYGVLRLSRLMALRLSRLMALAGLNLTGSGL